MRTRFTGGQFRLILFVAIVAARPTVVGAQQPSSVSTAAVGGAGLRGPGQVADCCGPFQSDVGLMTSLWLGGSVSRELGPPIAVDIEATWAREPRYRAYVQALVGDAPYRGYESDSLVSSVIAAGLLRWHVLGTGGTAIRTVDVVGGVGWVHHRHVSDLRSIVFRPGPEPAPEYRFHTSDARNTAASVTGLDIGIGGDRVSLAGQVRLYWHWPRATARSDGDLGRQVVRLGAGLRVRL